MAVNQAVARFRRLDERMKVRKIMFIDAEKAHLNPGCHKEVFIELPKEAVARNEIRKQLVYLLYGCKPRAHAWEQFLAEKLEGDGFTRGNACIVIFYHEPRDLLCVCRWDHFTLVGEQEDLLWIAREMRK